MLAPVLIQNNGNGLSSRKSWIDHLNVTLTILFVLIVRLQLTLFHWTERRGKKEVMDESWLLCCCPSATGFYCCQFSEVRRICLYLSDVFCLSQEMDIEIFIKFCSNDSCHLHESGKKLP